MSAQAKQLQGLHKSQRNLYASAATSEMSQDKRQSSARRKASILVNNTGNFQDLLGVNQNEIPSNAKQVNQRQGDAGNGDIIAEASSNHSSDLNAESYVTDYSSVPATVAAEVSNFRQEELRSQESDSATMIDLHGKAYQNVVDEDI